MFIRFTKCFIKSVYEYYNAVICIVLTFIPNYKLQIMKMKITTWAAAILFIVAGCRQKTTKDGTMVDRETGYTEEQLDNRGGQAQSQDSTGNELFDNRAQPRTDTVN
jgi:hypothetical protein